MRGAIDPRAGSRIGVVISFIITPRHGFDWRFEIFSPFTFRLDLVDCADGSHLLYRSFHFERYQSQLLVRPNKTGHLFPAIRTCSRD